MACGVVPVCLQMKSGITEQIKQGVSGFVVKDRYDDFLNAIKTLQTDHTLWLTMSKNAQQYISENFTMRLCHNNWFNYFSSFKSQKNHVIPIPISLRLPSIHPDLARADRRKPRLDIVTLLKLRLGLLKHKAYFFLKKKLKLL
jgi:hypothetical protein